MKTYKLRLWQKIYLLSLALLVCAISAVCAFLIRNSLSNMIAREEYTAGRTHAYLTSSVQNAVLYEQLRQSVSVLGDEELNKIFQSTLGGQSQTGVSIYLDGKRIYSHLPCPEQSEKKILLQQTDSLTENQYTLSQYAQDGGTKLLVSSTELIQNTYYSVISNTDITEVYSLHHRQTIGFLLITAVSAVLIAVLLALAIRRMLSPLSRMNREVKQIAQGEYHRRLPLGRGDELGELSENMNQMAASIEEKVRSLEQVAQNRKVFIDNLTHEMKTPLTTILGYGDMLRITQSLPEEKRREYSGVIVDEAKRLRTLSGKLMELTSMDAFAAGNLTQTPVSELFERASTAIRPLYEARTLTLACESDDFSLAVDPELFQSMLINLLDNAAKASRQGQTVLLCGRMEQNGPVISVTDQGIGIPADKISQITEPFFMVDKARSRRSGGAGLGLALCARIAALHGASLTVQSREGEGACIRIVFHTIQETSADSGV